MAQLWVRRSGGARVLLASILAKRLWAGFPLPWSHFFSSGRGAPFKHPNSTARRKAKEEYLFHGTRRGELSRWVSRRGFTFSHGVPEWPGPVEEDLALVFARKPVVHLGPTAPEKLGHDALHWISQQGCVPRKEYETNPCAHRNTVTSARVGRFLLKRRGFKKQQKKAPLPFARVRSV
jgi:hypothetical protein